MPGSDRVLAKIHLEEEVKRVGRDRKKVEKQLLKLGQVYLDDDLMEYDEYQRRKRKLEDRLASLVVPGVDSAKEAGKLLEALPSLWKKAGLTERHNILVTMLDAVYVDSKNKKRIVSIRPKPAFRPLFEVATMRKGSKVCLVTETTPEKEKASSSSEDAFSNTLCWWWRRGRVELPVQKTPRREYTTSLSGTYISLPRFPYRLEIPGSYPTSLKFHRAGVGETAPRFYCRPNRSLKDRSCRT